MCASGASSFQTPLGLQLEVPGRVPMHISRVPNCVHFYVSILIDHPSAIARVQ